MVPQAGQVCQIAQASQSARSAWAANLIVFQSVEFMALNLFLTPLPIVFSPLLSAQNPVLTLHAFPMSGFHFSTLLLAATLINFRFLSQRLDYSEKFPHLT